MPASGPQTPMLRLFCALLPCLLALPAAAEIYRWVDENGTVVYSQTPPPDGRRTTTVAPPPPPAEDPAVARKRLEEQIRRLEQSAEARRKAEAKKAKTREEAARREARCRQARRNLEILNTRPPNTLYRVGDEYRRFTMEELEARRRQLEAAIEEHCKR